MWLETLILQTHQSYRDEIEAICHELFGCDEHLASALEIYLYESTVLNVTCHLRHETGDHTERSLQATRLMAVLQHYGPVQHRAWLPL
ncbi:hypothetical protein [Alteromonas gracilis]|uniref:hypothetical protein n=1 Tax=Alteromonas gracilis TaxID=1479524 RepID=UPI0030D1ED83